MGAYFVQSEAFGETARQAFESLCSEAEFWGGHDPDIGAINTCCFEGIRMTYCSPSKENIRHAQQFINKDIKHVGKRTAYAVDLGIDHYEVVTAKKSLAKRWEKAVFAKRYVFSDGGRKHFYTTKSAADKDAIACALRTGSHVDVYCRYVKVSGDSKVSAISVNVRRVSRPPKQKGNMVVRAIHRYFFYGMAAC